VRVEPGDHGLVGIGRVAVGEQDDVLDGGGGVAQRLVGGIQVRRVGRWIPEVHRVDLRLDLRLVRQGAEGDDHVAHRAIGHAHFVPGGQLVDDGVGRPAHHLVPGAALTGLEHQHDRDRRLLHVLGKLDLHRERGLQWRARVAARPVAFAAANDNQAHAEVADRGLQERHGIGPQAGGGQVDEHDRLVGGEVRGGPGQGRRRDRRAGDPSRMERRLEAAGVARRRLDEEDARGADDLDQGLPQVVLRVGVADRVDHDPDGVESGIAGLHQLAHRRLAHREIEFDRADQGAVEVPADGGRGDAIADESGADGRLLTLCQRSRRAEPVDVGLHPGGNLERQRVHPHTFGAEQPSLGHGVAKVCAPV